MIGCATFAIYYPALRGAWLMDDRLLVSESPLVHSPDGLRKIWFSTEPSDYWPVTNSSFWIEWRLWGNNTAGYHVTNVVLHTLNAVLLWIVLSRLKIPGAFLAAMIFAVHPVSVQSVAWIAQRKNVLSMCFFLLSVLCFVRSIGFDRWLWLSLIAFLLAMLAKGSVVMLPVALAAILWWCGQLSSGRQWLRIAPFVLVAIPLTLLNIWFQTHGQGQVIRNVGILERIAGAGAIIWFYLYKTLFPIKLAFFYPNWRIDAGNPLWWLPLAGAIAVTVALWKLRDRCGKSPLLAWVFFCAMLVPVMGLTDVGFMQFALVSDPYAYLALLAVVTGAGAVWARWRDRSSAAVVLAVIIVGALAAQSWRQARRYRDSEALYRAAIEAYPRNGVARYMLAKTCADEGRKDEAMTLLEQAVALAPDHGVARYDYGAALLQAGQPEQAIPHLRRAVELEPTFAQAHNNLAIALSKTGRAAEAIPCFERAIAAKPDYFEAYNNLGLALAESGQPEAAVNSYQEAIRLKPDYTVAHVNLGATLSRLGRSDEAIASFEKAIELARAQGRNDLANQLQTQLDAFRARSIR